MDLDDILNLDIEALKKEMRNPEPEPKPKPKPHFPDHPPSPVPVPHPTQTSISEPNLNHRLSFGLIPRNIKTETIDLLEKAYHSTGKYPPIQAVSAWIEDLGFRKDVPRTKEEWQNYLTHASFEEILINRGLPTYDSHVQRIDLNFSLAVTLICDISDKRSIAAKLKDAGLTTRQWEGFLKRKSHYDFFNSRLTRVWDEEVEQKAKLGIIRSVEAGDLTAIKYFHEYTDRYRPQDQQLINLQIIITGLLEILAKHLTKDVLITVAAELEQTGLLTSTSKANLNYPAALSTSSSVGT